jgi:predicted metal-dependent peptidase
MRTENVSNEIDDNVLDRIIRAKIQIQSQNPFFSYMSLYLKPIQDNNVETAGVDIKGNMYYNSQFISKLTDDRIKFVLAHEMLHLVFLHLVRQGTRDRMIFNYAADLCINNILRDNGYTPIKDCLIPDYNGTFKKDDIKIENIQDKNAEMVYDELIKQIKDNKLKGQFDKHIYGENMTEEEKRAVSKEWEEKIENAMTRALQKGDIPKGLERLLNDLHKEEINWKKYLSQYITKEIKSGYSYTKPHKRSQSVGYYKPHDIREKIEIGICVDLSGSIGDTDYADFLSEVIGMARAFQDKIDFKFYSHDTEGYFNGFVRNGNVEKIKNIKMKGGEGTDFNNVAELMNKENLKLVVWLTDGYGTEINKPFKYNILWVLNSYGNDEIVKKYGKVIKLNSQRGN